MGVDHFITGCRNLTAKNTETDRYFIPPLKLRRYVRKDADMKRNLLILTMVLIVLMNVTGCGSQKTTDHYELEYSKVDDIDMESASSVGLEGDAEIAWDDAKKETGRFRASITFEGSSSEIEGSIQYLEYNSSLSVDIYKISVDKRSGYEFLGTTDNFACAIGKSSAFGDKEGMLFQVYWNDHEMTYIYLKK